MGRVCFTPTREETYAMSSAEKTSPSWEERETFNPHSSSAPVTCKATVRMLNRSRKTAMTGTETARQERRLRFVRLCHRPQRVAAGVKRRLRGFRPRLTFGIFSASFSSARAGSRLYRCRVIPSDSPSVTKKTAKWSRIFIGST